MMGTSAISQPVLAASTTCVLARLSKIPVAEGESNRDEREQHGDLGRGQQVVHNAAIRVEVHERQPDDRGDREDGLLGDDHRNHAEWEWKAAASCRPRPARSGPRILRARQTLRRWRRRIRRQMTSSPSGMRRQARMHRAGRRIRRRHAAGASPTLRTPGRRRMPAGRRAPRRRAWTRPTAPCPRPASAQRRCRCR